MEPSSLSLLGLFMQWRPELKRRLRRRLGSDELVNDVLQETYLRVERMGDTSVVSHNPEGYLFRMALNVAADQRQAESRYLTGEEVEELLHFADDALDPARIVHACRTSRRRRRSWRRSTRSPASRLCRRSSPAACRRPWT